MATNDALVTNPVQGARFLTSGGSDWLWAVFAIFVLSFLIHALLSVFHKRPTRGPQASHSYLPYLFTVGLLSGSLAYYAMASDLGSFAIPTSSGPTLRYPTYQIFWPKYAYWGVAFPAVVLTLGVLTRSSWPKILFGIGLSWIWVLSYFLSSMTRTRYKWGFFALGTVAWLYLALLTISMAFTSRKHYSGNNVANNTAAPAGAAPATSGAAPATSGATPATAGNGGVAADGRVAGGKTHAFGLIAWTNLLWLLYPIAFGISDGGNRIGVTRSFVFFGILDVLLLPVISFLAVWHTRKWGVLTRGADYYGYEKGGRGYGPQHGGAVNGANAAAPAPQAGTAAV